MAAGGEHRAARQWVPLQRQLVPATLDKEGETYSRNMRRRRREAIRNALRKGFLKTLDRDLILQQWEGEEEEKEETLSGSLEHVLRVSLPRSGVQSIHGVALLSCPQLTICNLPHCFVQDLSPFYGCVNLIKLDLSNNQVERLPPGDFWYSLSSLRVLYLHGNSISDKSCLRWMNQCPRLHVLTLYSTPLSLSRDYRHHVVNGIMTLQALDKHVISDEEIIENMSLQGAFQALSPQLRLQLYHPYHTETGFSVERRGVYQLLLAVDTALAHCSPVHIVQRWTRGWLTRRALSQSPDSRIKALVSKYQQSTTQRAQKAAPPPPNTACPTERTPHHHSSDPSSFKTRWNISLPAPQSVSPAFPMTPDRVSPNRAAQNSNPPQHPGPLESHTVAIQPGPAAKMYHSIHIDLEHSAPNQNLPIAAVRTGQAKQKGSSTNQDKPKKEKRLSVGQGKTEGRKDRRSWITVVGERADVLLERNQLEKLTESKKEAGRELREEEVQIMDTVEKTREPLSKDLRKVALPMTIHGAPRLSKDALAFGRVFESMTMSTFKAVDRIHEVQRMKENWERKANHVARMKTERERRRKKIQDFQQKTRESIEAWKIMEENKQMRLREKAAQETTQSILDRSLQRAASEKGRQKEKTDRSFATEFTRQSLNICHEVSKDDHGLSLEERREEIKREVQQVTEATRQKRQEAKAEREIREEQLVWEGELGKKELSRKMMQAAAQRMSEAKKRVGRAVIKREAAKASVDRARETFRKSVSRDSPVKLPPLKLDLRPESDLVEAGRDTLHEVGAGEPTPALFRLRCFTHEASRTWQRGTLVLAKAAQNDIPSAALFPNIDKASRAHHQLRPGRILHNIPPTPLHSELSELSPAETPTEHCGCITTAGPCSIGMT